MKNLLILPLFVLSFLAIGQKNSLTIKTGFTNSSIDNPLFHPLGFAEIGIGYTKKFSNMFWISVEPGVKTAGYRSSSTVGGVYLNTPIIGTFNMGSNKIIAALDAGYNPNFKITGGVTPGRFSEIIIGARAGYRISERISFEVYYRYGESTKNFYENKPLTINYISIQTRISLGKN